MSYGRTWDEQRFSPLDQINEGNVATLGLAWYETSTPIAACRRTPLFIDGVLYNVSVWNVVTAYDASQWQGAVDASTRRSRGSGRGWPAAARPRAASRCGRARSTSARWMAG